MPSAVLSFRPIPFVALSALLAACVSPSGVPDVDTDEGTDSGATSSGSGDLSSETSTASGPGTSTAESTTATTEPVSDDGEATSASSGMSSEEESSSSGTSGGSTPPPPWSLPDECAYLADESGYCLTSVPFTWALVGVDSGRVCEFGEPSGAAPPVVSVHWDGWTVIRCDGTVVRVRLDTGEVQDTGIACELVAEVDGAPAVFSPLSMLGDRQIDVYASAYALLAGDAPLDTYPVPTVNHMLTFDGQTVYSAWHSTDRVDVFELGDHELGPAIPLAGFAGWVDGMDVFGDDLLVLSGDALTRFDPQTGEQRASVSTSVDLGSLPGLNCVRNE